MGNNNCCKNLTDKNQELDLSGKNNKINMNWKTILKNLKKKFKKNLKTKSMIFNSENNNINPKLNKTLDFEINHKSSVKNMTSSKHSLEFSNNNNYNILRVNVNLFKKFIKDKIYNFYKVIEPIGQGGFGQIFLVKNKFNNQLRAMKVMNKDKIDKNNLLLEEFLFLKEFDHPNILKVYEFYQDNSNYYLITEYIKGGDLCENLSKIKNFSEKHISIVMKQLFSVLKYIHAKNIIHRDIKLENLLLVNNKNLEIKLIDFGISKRYESKKLTEKIGSFYYVAPEIIWGNYDKSCDIWACGIILYILLFNNFPFYSNDKIILFKKILKSSYAIPDNKINKLGNNIKDLLKKLLIKNPNERINIDDCLSHDFIKDNNSNYNSSLFYNIELNSFHTLNNMKKCLYSFISHTFMTSNKIDKYAKVFRKIDKNNDGVLNYKEFYKFYKFIYPFKNKDQLKKESIELFKSIDLDNDDQIEYSEFLNLLLVNEIKKNREVIKQTFNFFDKNGDGFIDIEEFKTIFSEWNLDPYQWQSLIKDIDKNNDNKIDINEFFEIFENKKYYQKLWSQHKQ